MTKSTKIFASLITLFISSFFFCSSVFADTINLTINNSVFDYDNEAYQTLKQTTLDYINEHSDANYYIIYYESTITQVNGQYTNVIDTTKINSKIINLLPSISLQYYAESSTVCNRISFVFSGQAVKGFQINTSSLSITTINNLLSFNQYYCSDNILNYVVIDTNITSNLNYNNTNNIFNLDNRGTIAIDNPIPTLVEMYPPTPPDSTPIITNYYSLIFEKLGVLTTYFKDNPYLYAIPLIPIFILCFYLIKRSLIK